MSKSNPTFQDLIKLEKHPGYFVNPISQKITYRRNHNGDSIKIPTGKTKIGEAKAFVEIELERRKSGSSLLAAKRKKMRITNPLIDDLYVEMINEYSPGKSKSTITNYWQAWEKGLKGFWAGETVNDINPQTIMAFKNWWLEEQSNKIPEKALDHLFMLFRWLVSRKHLSERPDVSALNDLEELVKKARKWKKTGRVYTDEEQIALLNCWRAFLDTKMEGTTPQHKVLLAARIRLAIMFGLRRGFRIGEIVVIEREKIDFKKGVLEVWRPKNGKWAEIPIEDDLEEALRYQIEANKHIDSKWLFASSENPSEHITPQVLSKMWYWARAHAGIVSRQARDARFHDLRKTFATMTARHGWAPKAACEFLDMTLAIYENTYANDVGLETKRRLVIGSFGGGR